MIFSQNALFFTILFALDAISADLVTPATICNPVDLDYRFQLQMPSRREAADPTMVFFKDEYWLFASKSGGYWHSPDLLHWKLVEPTGLPLENYAPTVIVLEGVMYFTAGGCRAIYTTKDPAVGNWTRVASIASYADPALFVDDNNSVYMYSGCLRDGNITIQQLDPKNGWQTVGKPAVGVIPNPAQRGWESGGENNDQGHPSIEGSWMTYHNGTYYLQYAAPGTWWKTYADGIFAGSNPLGPFEYAPSSPFSHNPTGFLAGSGHGSTFKDRNGFLWHITTSVLCVRQHFERRLSLFHSTITPTGALMANTYLGDYPKYISPVGKVTTPGWMLLSYNKNAQASSELPKFPISNAFDEDIKSWWSAKSGNSGEWLMVDLGKVCRVEAIQINFADQGASVLGRMHDVYNWYIEVSSDGLQWSMVIDRHTNTRDAPHEYVQLEQPIQAQNVRITNVHTPGGINTTFSIGGFRIFGNCLGSVPAKVTGATVTYGSDRRRVNVTWNAASGAEFYIIRYGIEKDLDQLYGNYRVYRDTTKLIPSLNDGVNYYFTVDAINDNGITKGTVIVTAQ